jgi:hypothetical protein
MRERRLTHFKKFVIGNTENEQIRNFENLLSVLEQRSELTRRDWSLDIRIGFQNTSAEVCAYNDVMETLLWIFETLGLYIVVCSLQV